MSSDLSLFYHQYPDWVGYKGKCIYSTDSTLQFDVFYFHLVRRPCSKILTIMNIFTSTPRLICNKIESDFILPSISYTLNRNLILSSGVWPANWCIASMNSWKEMDPLSSLSKIWKTRSTKNGCNKSSVWNSTELIITRTLQPSFVLNLTARFLQ